MRFSRRDQAHVSGLRLDFFPRRSVGHNPPQPRTKLTETPANVTRSTPRPSTDCNCACK